MSVEIKRIAEVDSVEVFVNRRGLLGDSHGKWAVVHDGLVLGLAQDRERAEKLKLFLERMT